MFLIVSKMIICLLLAALIGFFIGYFFCKYCKKSACNKKKKEEVNNFFKEEVVEKKEEFAKTTTTSATLLDKEVPVVDSTVESVKPLSVDKQTIVPDDLKKIKGIGVKIEEALYSLDIYTFKQIASWNEQNVKWVDEYLVFKGRIHRENWIEQAKVLADGGETEFSKKQDIN